MSVTELAIRRPSLVLVVFLALTLLGGMSYSLLKYELLPDFAPPVIAVTAVYPGASPEEVETNVSRKLEDALSSLEYLEDVRTTSLENVSSIVMEFDHAADIDQTLQDATRKVNAILNDLPEDVEQPTLLKFDPGEQPILRMGATADIDSRAFFRIVEDQIQPQLNNVPGVGAVTLVGGQEREIRVNVDPQKLRGYNLSILQVVQAVGRGNLDVPSGSLKGQDTQFSVRVLGQANNLQDLKQLVVARNPRTGADVLLQDIAEVRDGTKEAQDYNRINRTPSLGILIQKQADANAVETSAEVRARLKQLEEDYARIGLIFNVAQDTTEFTLASANAVKFDLVMAIILVALVMLVFLHSLRDSFIVMVAIPASLFSTFLAMYLLDYSLNLMTLLALSVVIGILVDDSIVVLENIHRHLEMRKPRRQAALEGRNEIGFTAVSITLVDVVVFVPLALVGGMIGNIMREFAITTVVATMMSLFVSFTITPMLASRFSKLQDLQGRGLMPAFGRWFEGHYLRIKEAYGRSLQGWLSGPKRVLAFAGATALFVGTIALIPAGYIGTEFIKTADRGEFSVTLELAPGTPLEKTNRITQEAERRLLALPEVSQVLASVGRTSTALKSTNEPNKTELSVKLVPKEQRERSTAQMQNRVREALYGIPGLQLAVRTIGIFGAADDAPIQFYVLGTQREEVRPAAEHVARLLGQVEGTVDVELTSEEGKPELQIDLDKTRMARLGLSVAEVGSALRTALTGNDDSNFREGGQDYPVRIMLDAFDRTSYQDVASMTFVNQQGQLIELRQFAEVRQALGPTRLERYNRIPSIRVNAQAVGRPVGDITNDFKTLLAQQPLPEGLRLVEGGQVKNMQESFQSLGLAFGAAVIFMYFIMVALYDNFITPLVVLFSIPLATIGALLALALTMEALSIFTLLGIIMLIGLVGKNAILLVDFTDQLRKHEGYGVKQALVQAGQDRLRPILMTTLSMVIGMLPIAVASGAGAEWKNGLAWAIIGGLLSSMLLTLYVVPNVYLSFYRLQRFFLRLGQQAPSPSANGHPEAFGEEHDAEEKPLTYS